jgi:hypothetical protein
MNYVVVLDGRTPTGKLFLKGTNDGLTTDGDQSHPVLWCDNVHTDSPYYLEAERTLHRGSESHPQSVRIPHAAVVAMFRWKFQPGTAPDFLAAEPPKDAAQT